MSITPAAPHRMSSHHPDPEDPKAFSKCPQGKNKPIAELRSWQIMDRMTKKRLEMNDLWKWQDMGFHLDPIAKQSIRHQIEKKTEEMRELWNQLEDSRYGGRGDV